MESSFSRHREKFILVIDASTLTLSCKLYDAATLIHVRSSARYEHPLKKNKSGRSEHKVSQIEDALVNSIVDVLTGLDPSVHEVVGISIANQRETFVAWDSETGELLHDKTIAWNDNRTIDEVAKLNLKWSRQHHEYIEHRTGLKVAPYYCASKMRWMIKNIEKVSNAHADRTLRFGTIDTYIIYRLTNQSCYVTDVTNASRTLLFNIHKLQFDKFLCQVWGINKESLPKVKPSCSNFGSIPNDFIVYRLRPRFTELPAILKGVPITGVIGDQQAALIGYGCLEMGNTKIGLDSSAFLLSNIGSRIPLPLETPQCCTVTPLLTIDGAPEKTMYCYEGNIEVACSGLYFLNKAQLASAHEIETMMTETVSSEGVVFVPSFNGIFTPIVNSNKRGAITGLTLDSDRSHILRAFVESLAIQASEILKKMMPHSDRQTSVFVDGLLSQSDAFLRILADFTMLKMVRAPESDMISKGAAICGSVGAAGASKSQHRFEQIEATLRQVRQGILHCGTQFSPTRDDTIRNYVRGVTESWIATVHTMNPHLNDKDRP